MLTIDFLACETDQPSLNPLPFSKPTRLRHMCDHRMCVRACVRRRAKKPQSNQSHLLLFARGGFCRGRRRRGWGIGRGCQVNRINRRREKEEECYFVVARLDCVDGREEKEKPFTKEEDLLCLPNKQSRSGVGFDKRVKSMSQGRVRKSWFDIIRFFFQPSNLSSAMLAIFCGLVWSQSHRKPACERAGEGREGIGKEERISVQHIY